ncbi:MAG: hypothetical protein IH595_03810 [Bacteroidales bacterium]|nr:hypothetical protein [Bacteroidales bacterium]
MALTIAGRAEGNYLSAEVKTSTETIRYCPANSKACPLTGIALPAISKEPPAGSKNKGQYIKERGTKCTCVSFFLEISHTGSDAGITGALFNLKIFEKLLTGFSQSQI